MPNGYDKNWARLCAAIDGFRVRYRRWPTRVRVWTPSLEDLRDHLFTPEDFARIESRVALVSDDPSSIVAEDQSGARFTYGEDGSGESIDETAADWLGVSPRGEEDYARTFYSCFSLDRL